VRRGVVCCDEQRVDDPVGKKPQALEIDDVVTQPASLEIGANGGRYESVEVIDLVLGRAQGVAA